MRSWSCAGLLLLALASSAAAQSTPTLQSALLAIDDDDPLELARVVQRYGDSALLALLRPDEKPPVRLVAMRAAPWLAEPELALPLLAPWVASRDSELAEAAARAMLQICQKLDRAELARREIAPAELTSVVAQLQRVEHQRWLRADLRLLVARIMAQLHATGVPRPVSP
jgi:hypothetical protein